MEIPSVGVHPDGLKCGRKEREEECGYGVPVHWHFNPVYVGREEHLLEPLLTRCLSMQGIWQLAAHPFPIFSCQEGEIVVPAIWMALNKNKTNQKSAQV